MGSGGESPTVRRITATLVVLSFFFLLNGHNILSFFFLFFSLLDLSQPPSLVDLASFYTSLSLLALSPSLQGRRVATIPTTFSLDSLPLYNFILFAIWLNFVTIWLSFDAIWRFWSFFCWVLLRLDFLRFLPPTLFFVVSCWFASISGGNRHR